MTITDKNENDPRTAAGAPELSESEGVLVNAVMALKAECGALEFDRRPRAVMSVIHDEEEGCDYDMLIIVTRRDP